MPDAGRSRRRFIAGLGAAVLALTPLVPATAKAPAVLRGRGDFRSLGLVNSRTGEWLKSVYWVDGEYVPEALSAYNHILRDWRQEAKVAFDPRTLDILAATQRLLDCNEPFEIISAYRTPSTNRMLRTQGGGVASNSYHMRGMAVDLRMSQRSVNQIARAGLSLNAGGVGRYNRSNFVHLDSGPPRDWGR